MVPRGDGVCTSISFNFHAWYRVEIRFSDYPRQKDRLDGIIWLKRKKCAIYRLDVIFSITHVVITHVVKDQLALSEGYSQMSVEGYRKKDTKLHTMSGS